MSAKPSSTETTDLSSELRQAIEEIDSGDYLELTLEQLQEWAETGELQMLDEWLESHD